MIIQAYNFVLITNLYLLQMSIPSQDPSAHLSHLGIKPSVQRTAILGYLMSHKTHPTADEIYRALLPEMPTLSRSTVYNTLWRMVEAGAIDALGIDRSNARFDYSTRPHAHLLCNRCGAIIDTEMPRLDNAVIGPKGARIDHVTVTYHGLCQNCASEN